MTAGLLTGAGAVGAPRGRGLLLIREAFLRRLSTRAVGGVVALITAEPVSAQPVSRLTRDLDQAMAQFHQGAPGRRLAVAVSRWRQSTGSAPLATAADDQQHRTLLRGSPAADTPDGLFRQRPERRAEYLFDL